MKRSLVSTLIFTGLLSIIKQGLTNQDCVCELKDSKPPFPTDKLDVVQTVASNCTETISTGRISDVDRLWIGLQKRLKQLEEHVVALEREDDADLYGAVSLRIIEIEVAEILDLINKLNETSHRDQHLSSNTAKQLKQLKKNMKEMEAFDEMQVVKKQQLNQRLKRDLQHCEEKLIVTPQPPTQAPENCPQGHFLNVSGPRSFSTTEFGSSYAYGSWGHDPKPAVGKESWYWLVPLSVSNVYSNFVRQYSSLSAMIVGVSSGTVTIASSNPTTNTVQGPNVVMYGDALYYGCYNYPSICRFNMTSRAITTVPLPKSAGYNSKFNFCHLEACYGYTDVDVSTDESGVWVVYSSPDNFGNLVLSEVLPVSPPSLGRKWNTSVHKRTVTNTFVACGILYALRFVDKDTEEIYYSFDTETGQEKYDLGVKIKKMSTNIQSLNYSPRDRLLYVYSDSKVLTYDVIFG